MLRERIVALGRRDARGRVAYLLCELVWRHAAIGQSEDNSIRLPLTRILLADTLGLTAVHVNRVLQELRANKLITLEHRRLALLNSKALQQIAELSQDYLNFGGASNKSMRYLDQQQARGT